MSDFKDLEPVLLDDEFAQSFDATSPVGLGKYRLIAQMAACAWGPLWVARGSSGAHEGRIVSLRRIARKPPVDAPMLRKLAASAFAAESVRDARIAAVLDVVITEDEVVVATEYVEGELLRSLQRRMGLGNRPLDVAVALRLAVDVASAAIAVRDGLRTATAEDPSLGGAVPGGISPDSILVASYGDPILLDVGVTGLLLSRAEIAAHPEVAAYRAPEQVVRGAVDERASVFSLGILAWELLTNRPLFGSPKWARFVAPDETKASLEEATRTRHRVLEMPIPRLDAVVRAGSAIPRDVAAIVARALERNADDRFASIERFRDALVELGADRFASTEDVAESVASIASTSLEARRVALASVGGPPSGAPEVRSGALRSTIPPPGGEALEATKLEELAWSPNALRSLETNASTPPPLPKRRAPNGS